MSRRILLVDPIAGNRIILRTFLYEAFDALDQAVTGAEALEALAADPPDLVLVHGPPPDMTAAELARAIKARAPALPVLLVTPEEDGAAVVEGLAAGADAVLRRPVDGQLLLAQMRALKRSVAVRDEWQARADTARDLGFAEPAADWAAPLRVALVGASADDPAAARLRDELAQDGPRRDGQGRDGQGRAGRVHAVIVTPDVALTGPPADAYVLHADLSAPRRGLALLAELRARAATRNAPVLVVLRAGDRDGAVTALDTGASDILTDAAEPGELALRLTTQMARKAEADRMRQSVEVGLRLAAVDPLTGLWNRRYALPHLHRMAERTAASGQTWAVTLFDIDRFKQVNDRFGHAAGDRVLAEVAERLRLHTRTVDLVARIGGEEFLVALPEGSLSVARQVAERIRQRVAAQPVAVPGLPPVAVTVSAGIALGTPGASVEAVLARADRALMRCKSGGRNQVRIAGSAA